MISSLSGSSNWAGSLFAAPQHQRKSLPLGNLLTTDLDILGGQTPGAQERGVEAQKLLHRRSDQGWVLPQLAQLVRMAQQGQQPVPDQSGGRLVTGCQQRDAGGDQFGLAQHLAPFLRSHQRADQVILGLFPPRLD